MDCIFCRIARGEIPARKAAETDRAVAFHDLNPQAPVHVLVIPKAHFTAARDAVATPEGEALVGHLVAVAAQVARDAGIDAAGYRLVTNTGPDGGQSVHHLHLHLLGGRGMGWPPG